MENPWQTPEAPLEAEPQGQGPLMPFEEGGRPLFTRLWETLSLVLRDPQESGRRLGAVKAVAPAVAYFAWVGMPLQWIAQAVIVARSAADPAQNEALFRFLHLPPQPPPTPEQVAFTRTFSWVGVALAPLGMAIGVLVMGLLAHLGLWMLKGLSRGGGLEVTFRSLLYVSGSTAWLGFLSAFLVFLPGSGLHLVHQVLSVGLGLGVLTFQGLVLAHAHGEPPWKGILGILLPPLLFFCICACGLGVLMSLAGSFPR